MDSVLLDSDVVLDFLFDRKPFSLEALQIMSLCENQKLKGYITPVIISNLYYILRKQASHKLVVEKLKQLLTIIDVLSMDKQTVLSAIHSEFKDFEDALQNCSAQNSGEVKTILTRNGKDFKKSKLAILTPEMYLNSHPNI
ncbi:MAG: PIN domain-containing protein [Aequorivita sp.]|nr:PIN domain-containing protein [Aequorivita sp.]